MATPAAADRVEVVPQLRSVAIGHVQVSYGSLGRSLSVVEGCQQQQLVEARGCLTLIIETT